MGFDHLNREILRFNLSQIMSRGTNAKATTRSTVVAVRVKGSPGGSTGARAGEGGRLWIYLA
jgi:hypothetical protein